MATTSQFSVNVEGQVTIRPSLPSETYVRKTMPGILGRFDMLATYVVALFLITNAVLGATGGPVSLVYLIIGAITFFLPCIIATIQLGAMFPYEGGLYNWTYQVLGPGWSLFAGMLYWLTGVLASITGADAFVSTIQGLNQGWLTQPWQQGLVILGLLTLGAIIVVQRFRVTQHVVNGIFILTMLSVFLIGLAATVWLLSGHASATNFWDPSGWSMNPGNFSYLGIITLNFIGVNGPLTMAGEMANSGNKKKTRSIIIGHLVWGSLIVFLCYFAVMLAVLVVRGPAILTAAVTPFEAFTAVYVVLGKVAGNLAVLFFLCYGFVAVIFYSYSSSRILMVAGIDQRVPTRFGKLYAKNRVPTFAVMIQLIFGAVVVALVFIVAPYLGNVGGNVANNLTDYYSVFSAATTLVWTVATMFLFINLVALLRRWSIWMRTQATLNFPKWLLWLCVVVGIVACTATITGILTYSWIPQLISSNVWWIFVGGLAVVCIIIVGVSSLVATSEASFESMKQ